ncbi:MAG TPA: hypothetical protein VF997_08965 [Polyangia bacterium]
MTRVLAPILVSILVACATGCGSDPGASGPDMALPACPAVQPADRSMGCGPSDFSYDCSYADSVCTCAGGQWYCRSSACPPPTARPATCDTPGLSCTYGFEDTCHCVGPENRWVCCGGVGRCPIQAGDTLCCPPPSSSDLCSPGSCSAGVPQCRCQSFHLSCAPLACDGGV